MTGAYLSEDPKRIAATVALLRHFRAFLASDCERMIDPTSGWHRDELDKAGAQRRLTWLVDMAVNRKAGLPDVRGRRDCWESRARWRRDQDALKRGRVDAFESEECQRHLAHRLARDCSWCGVDCLELPFIVSCGRRFCSEDCARQYWS